MVSKKKLVRTTTRTAPHGSLGGFGEPDPFFLPAFLRRSTECDCSTGTPHGGQLEGGPLLAGMPLVHLWALPPGDGHSAINTTAGNVKGGNCSSPIF